MPAFQVTSLEKFTNEGSLPRLAVAWKDKAPYVRNFWVPGKCNEKISYFVAKTFLKSLHLRDYGLGRALGVNTDPSACLFMFWSSNTTETDELLPFLSPRPSFLMPNFFNTFSSLTAIRRKKKVFMHLLTEQQVLQCSGSGAKWKNLGHLKRGGWLLGASSSGIRVPSCQEKGGQHACSFPNNDSGST